jgi:hypothetical protein
MHNIESELIVFDRRLKLSLFPILLGAMGVVIDTVLIETFPGVDGTRLICLQSDSLVKSGKKRLG